jgi:hypothetical protein
LRSHHLFKFIFLDIDGVLNKGLIKSNSPASDIISLKYGWMNKSLVSNLNKLTRATGAKIVISSSWRLDTFKETLKALEGFGIVAEIVDQTPDLGNSASRGDEIKSWLEKNKQSVDKYIIIDDCHDILPEQEPYFIHTDAYTGLSNCALHNSINTLSGFQNIR